MADFERLQQLYAAGTLPWDHNDPPPEVVTEAAVWPLGRALDLGTGLGRAALHLARLGWQVDGVDFIPEAVAEATRRAQAAGLAARVSFHQSTVTRLDFLTGAYDLAVDVGCAHGLNATELTAYHAQLKRLLRGGARYLLFAHLNDAVADADAQRWLNEPLLYRIFADGFTLERVEYGETTVQNNPTWRSAWFWWRRDDTTA
ncbi:MAG: class I SAM-dependent methyltransferase [Caldilineales bacterium]